MKAHHWLLIGAIVIVAIAFWMANKAPKRRSLYWGKSGISRSTGVSCNANQFTGDATIYCANVPGASQTAYTGRCVSASGCCNYPPISERVGPCQGGGIVHYGQPTQFGTYGN